jgi:hypothetical protein
VRDRLRAPPVLVGRDGELAELLAGLEDAAAGAGRLFLLVGDPGIGKSRLAFEAAAWARDRGFKVAWGRAGRPAGHRRTGRGCRRCGSWSAAPAARNWCRSWGRAPPFVVQIVAEVAEMLLEVGPPLPRSIRVFLRRGSGRPVC